MVQGFAPTRGPAEKSPVLLQVVNDKQKDNWFFGDLSGISDWFALPQTQKQTKKKDLATSSVEGKEDWVASVFNKFSAMTENKAEKVDVQGAEGVVIGMEDNTVYDACLAMTDREAANEAVVGLERDTFPDPLLQEMDQAKFPGALPQVMEDDLSPESDARVIPAVLKMTQPQTSPMFESTYAWIQRDMMKAGNHGEESDDWVAEDMRRQGQVQEDHGKDWVAKDMMHHGKAENDFPTLNEKAKKVKSREEMIAEDMRAVGKATGDDWVARDMTNAGKGENEGSHPKFDKLRHTLDNIREHNYDDIYEDMKKAGRQGSDKIDWIARDMEAAGRAVETSDRIASISHHESYDFPKGTVKAWDKDWLRKDMQDTGRGKARDSLAHDLVHASHNTLDAPRKTPVQKEELVEWLNYDKDVVAEDMIKEGKAVPGYKRKESKVVSRANLNDMVVADMATMGQNEDDWIARDMELVGHPQALSVDRGHHINQKQRETEEFMKSRQPVMVPWVPTLAEAQLDGYEFEKTTESQEEVYHIQGFPAITPETSGTIARDGIHPLRGVKEIAKKVFIPWTPWGKL